MPRTSASMTHVWDYIIVGGGLTGSVVAHRLLEQEPSRKILLIEAGVNTHEVKDIEHREMNTEVDGSYQWGLSSVPQRNLGNRIIASRVGKGLGGGTVVNAATWARGHSVDYDIWAERVGDRRWSYEAQLPYMRKTETMLDSTMSPSAHGQSGPVKIQTGKSTGRSFPLREAVFQSWKELGVEAVPRLDGNAGNNVGVAEFQENRDNGRRQLASMVYSLDGIEVMTESLVGKVLVEKSPTGEIVAKGVQLDDGSRIVGRNTILAAGVYKTPQILLLSGIGPADTLKKFDIPVVLNQPAVGENLHDHFLVPTFWKLKDPSAGYAKESGNPLFEQSQYKLGAFIDFITVLSLPKDGLKAAIEEDEGPVTDPTSHALLNQDRAFASHMLQYSGASTDGSVILMISTLLINSSRGTVTIQSNDIKDSPLIDPNFLNTSTDRYAAREMVRQSVKVMASGKTVLGREIIAGEMSLTGSPPLTDSSTDDEVDNRVREIGMGCYHPAGTASMGTVVDTDLSVIGVSGLRVVDTSVFPVPISANLQVAAYALAEQAAVIIGSAMTKA